MSTERTPTSGRLPQIDRAAVGLDCPSCGHHPHGADNRRGIDVRCGEIVSGSWSGGGPKPVHCECLDYGEVYKAHQWLLREARREARGSMTARAPQRQVPVLREALSLGAPDILEIVGDRLGLIVDCLNASGYRIEEAAKPTEEPSA